MGEHRKDAAQLTPAGRSWPLVVRRARPEDRDAVLGFASRTWDGWDYIPNAWPVWLRAADGVLLVACRPGDDTPIAVARVAMVTPTEAWLEGIRVDPQARGLDVATDFQAAELQWARAQGATVVRYATGARNEASHRLGARHGFALRVELRSYSSGEQGLHHHDEPSAYDPDVRARATDKRRALLDVLREDGAVAVHADAAALWQRVADDETFRGGARLYEARPWAMAELDAARFGRHVDRGEVIVADGDTGAVAISIVAREQLPAEDSSLRLALLIGDVPAAVSLVERCRNVAGDAVRFRVPEGSPLQRDGAGALRAAGWQASDASMHVLERPIDDAHPLPGVDARRLTLADQPSSVLRPPTA